MNRVESLADRRRKVREMWESGATSVEIGHARGMPASTVSRWVRSMDLARRPSPIKPKKALPDHTPRPCGEPLPAGHPVSWGAIVAGTCLEGQPFR